MLKQLYRIPLKTLKITVISILVLALVLFSLPFLFPTYISNQVKTWANRHIQTELAFGNARLSFFEHFPSLTLTLHDFSLKGSAPFQQDTLVVAKKVSLGVNLLSLFGSAVNINEVYLSDGSITVLVNKAGQPNYNVYSADVTGKEANAKTDTSNASLKLQKIQVNNCKLRYSDESVPFHLSASHFNYTGKGDLDKMVFDLKSRLEMKHVSIAYNNERYIENKHLQARLITKVNTGSLQLIFEENDIQVNDLPVRFNGSFNFLDNGYHMDLNVATEKAAFRDFFTALPPSALQWLERTTVKGDVELAAQLKGKYVVAENAAPDLCFRMKVTDGSVASKLTKQPIENIQLSLSGNMPSLATERVHLQMDTIHATLGRQFLSGGFELKGLVYPMVKGRISASADLGLWNKTLALENLNDIRGTLNLNVAFNGILNRNNGQWPVILANVDYRNGYIKTSYYPSAITDIQVLVTVKNASGTNRGLSIATSPISFRFENKPFTIKSTLNNLDNLTYSVHSKGIIDIGKIYRVFAIDGYDVNGSIATAMVLQGSQADINAKRFDKLHHSGTLQLQNISVTGATFPKPLTINTGSFVIKNDRVIAEAITCRYGSTTATLEGHLNNILNYSLSNNASLEGRLVVKADMINVAELMTATHVAMIDDPATTLTTTQSVAPAGTGIVIVPANLDLQLVAGVDKINYDGLLLQNCQSKVTVRQGSLSIDKAAFEVIGAPVNFSGTYSPAGVNNAKFTASITADAFDVNKAYKEVKFFSEMAPSAANVKGIVSLNYQLNGRLDQNMQPVLSSLKGGGVLTLKQVKVYGFKMLSAIRQRTGKQFNDKPDLSKIELKTTIANNIMKLERTKLRIAGFRPRFEGEMSLDGRLNIRCRLGLPPFGIIGIPLSITGTQDKPLVRFRRGRAADDLQGTADDADEEDKKESEEAAAKEELEKNI